MSGKKEELNEKCLKNSDNYDKTLIAGFHRGFLKIVVLWIITKERIHGYEIIKKLKKGKDENNCPDFTSPGSNRMYPILKELEKKELIEGSWESQGKRKIKYYEATEKGKNTVKLIKNHFHDKNHSNGKVPQIMKEFWVDIMLNKSNLNDNDLQKLKEKLENS